jgi:hypothetical protein
LRRLIRHAPDFRKDNGEAIRNVCRGFVVLCRRIDLFSDASIAIDGSKFRAVNTRDRNFTQAKMQRRLEQIDESINRYLSQGLCRIAPRGLRFVSTCPRVNKMSTLKC